VGGRGAQHLGLLPVLECVEAQRCHAATHGRGRLLEQRQFFVGHGADEAQSGMEVLRGHALPLEPYHQRRRAIDEHYVLVGAGLHRKEQPQHLYAATAAGNARNKLSAYSTDWRRTASRSPSNWIRCPWHSSRSGSLCASANHTVPTGLPGTAPPGPAMPLTAMAILAPVRPSAPSAMARTTASLTAPSVSMSFSGTPRSRVLAAFE